MNEEEIEKKISEKKLTAPRITLQMIENLIDYDQYHHFPGTTTTVCMLMLKNGFTIIGESACVSAENFDAELGRKIALDDAKSKIWGFEGYRLQCEIAKKEQSA